MTFLWSFLPPTADLPVYDALRADLAASGEESLQTANLKASPMRSWIGLYALLYMIRQNGMTDFTREGIKSMLDTAKDVPMLGMFGDENWTPNLDHPGLFKRAGMNHWAIYGWDSEAKSPGTGKGNYEQVDTISFDEVLCGSPFGAPKETC
jgi:hypothetical protein